MHKIVYASVFFSYTDAFASFVQKILKVKTMLFKSTAVIAVILKENNLNAQHRFLNTGL